MYSLTSAFVRSENAANYIKAGLSRLCEYKWRNSLLVGEATLSIRCRLYSLIVCPARKDMNLIKYRAASSLSF
jgi:hypothetical protein